MSTARFNDPPIGIDLGTTFSCIAVYRKGRADIIADKNGDRLIPSIVFYDPDTGDTLVGKAAYDEEPSCFGNCLRDVKRIIGRRFDDEFIKEYATREDVQFKIVNENEKAVFEVEINGNPVKKSPEEVSAEILKYLKEMAETYLKQKVCKVVISVPAYFSNAQRKATKTAAELAGLELLRFITEPSAAGSHYIQGKDIKGKILVFDWGGGTLDVSFVRVKNKIFEVKSVCGDSLLGGRDIDNILFKHFHKPDVKNVRSIRRLQRVCSDLKKKLSISDKGRFLLDFYNQSEDLLVVLTREEFEDLNKSIFKNAVDIVEYGLYDIGWEISEIKHIILVGGSTRIPKIREMLKSFFNNKDYETDLNPDEAVAAGAALQAHRLKHNNEDIEKTRLVEVNPLSLGIKIEDNLMSVLIPRNSPLPYISEELTLITATNNQRSVLFSIYEGERQNCLFNNKLGEFSINNIPLKRAGDVKFTVTFQLDEDGILEVRASEKSSGKSKKLIVTLGDFRVNRKKVKYSIAESKKMKQEDEKYRIFVKRKWDLMENCYHILYDIHKIKDVNEQTKVKEACEAFLDHVKLLNYTNIDAINVIYNEMYDSMYPILKKYRFVY